MPHRQGIGGGIATRRGEEEDQNRTVVTDKVTEQLLVRRTAASSPTTLTVPSGGVTRASSRKRGTSAIQEVVEARPKREVVPDISVATKGIKGIRTPNLEKIARPLAGPPAPKGELFGTSRGTDEITETGQRKLTLTGPAKRPTVITGGVRKRKSFDPFTRGGRENIFSTAGEILENLPETLRKRGTARGAALGAKGRRADLKLANERIKALTSVQKNLLSLDLDAAAIVGDEIQELIRTTASVGGVGRGLDPQFGFLASLRESDEFTDDQLKRIRELTSGNGAN